MSFAKGFVAVCVFGVLAVQLSSGQTTFHEANGLVVVECESVPPGDGWVVRDEDYVLKDSYTLAGVSGKAYHMTTGSEGSGAVRGTMTYNIKITNPGSYRLYMRGMEAPIESGRGDYANDCYIKMDGQPGCEGRHTKFVRLGNSFVWSWKIMLECGHHTFFDPVYDLSAGVHRFHISGRSKNFLIDRFVLKNSSLSAADPKNLNLPESSTDGSTVGSIRITSPAAGTALAMGSTVTLRGEGSNLTWSYDAVSDGKGVVAIGSGAEVPFSVPTDVSGPKTITITLVGSGGVASETYSLTSETVSVHRVLQPMGQAQSAPVVRYSIAGRRMDNSSGGTVHGTGIAIVCRGNAAAVSFREARAE